MSTITELIIEDLQDPSNTFESDAKSAFIDKLKSSPNPLDASAMTDDEKAETNRILARNFIGLVIG